METGDRPPLPPTHPDSGQCAPDFPPPGNGVGHGYSGFFAAGVLLRGAGFAGGSGGGT